MSEPWNGNERRASERDHDTLIQIVQIMDNHVKNFDTHTTAFRAHEIQDQKNFTDLRSDVLKIQRIVWMATGVIIAVEALPTFLKIFHILNK